MIIDEIVALSWHCDTINLRAQAHNLVNKKNPTNYYNSTISNFTGRHTAASYKREKSITYDVSVISIAMS